MVERSRTGHGILGHLRHDERQRILRWKGIGRGSKWHSRIHRSWLADGGRVGTPWRKRLACKENTKTVMVTEIQVLAIMINQLHLGF